MKDLFILICLLVAAIIFVIGLILWLVKKSRLTAITLPIFISSGTGRVILTAFFILIGVSIAVYFQPEQASHYFVIFLLFLGFFIWSLIQAALDIYDIYFRMHVSGKVLDNSSLDKKIYERFSPNLRTSVAMLIISGIMAVVWFYVALN